MRKFIFLVLTFLLLTGCQSWDSEKNEEVVTTQNEEIETLEEEIRNKEIEIDESATEYELVRKDLNDTSNKFQELEKILEETNKLFEEKITTLKEENKKLEENNTNFKKQVEASENNGNVVGSRVSEAQFESIIMSRFSAMSRLMFDRFDNLSNIYRLEINYDIENDWYIISDDYFELELLDNTDAIQVEFFLLKLESEFVPLSLYIDSDGTDGWSFNTNNIDEFIEPHRESGGFKFEAYYVIYSEILRTNNEVEQSSVLPIYNIGSRN